MKRKKLCMSLLLITAFFKGYSQNYKNAFGISAGATKDGYGIMLSHNYFIHRNNSIATSILVTDAKYKIGGDKIGYNDITLNLGYSMPLYLTKDRKFGIVLGVGTLLGYEIADTKKDLNLDESKVIYGVYGGLDFDYLISKRTTIFIKINEYYHLNSDLDNFIPFAGIGLRYYSN